VGAAVVVVLLISSAAGVQAYREVRYPPRPVTEDRLYVTSGTALRRLTIGFHSLAADIYWIRAIQYYGGTKLRLTGQPGQPAPAGRADAHHDYSLLYPMLDLTTTLDPRFNIAYRFGALFLAEPFPGGAGRPDLAIALLEKGLRARPDKWEYMQDAGFVHYWWRHDYAAAADWFSRASDVPGAPWWLKSLAATTLAEGGDRRSSRVMWESLRESAEIEWLKVDAERRLTQLQALDQIDELQAHLKLAAERGFAVGEWNAIVHAGVLPGIPLDPVRVPYELDAEGRVLLSSRSPLFPLPNEPQRLKPLP
jgi:hypothetical protein